MGRNSEVWPVMRKCINIYERWERDNRGQWNEWRIREYSDGSASREFACGPLTEKEYFKQIMKGGIS